MIKRFKEKGRDLHIVVPYLPIDASKRDLPVHIVERHVGILWQRLAGYREPFVGLDEL